MSDFAIRARNLTKVYRLYSRPHDRFLDIFGLLKAGPDRFREHAALDGVSLDIRRGEKVAVIGRNGAGKSTFLKLVTQVIEPTSGEITVAGKVHALLQIGTGFHLDFTGRENVYAYLAQLGVTGAEAERRCAEIIEFSELESYIDQPVKTYSSGMSVRLMFSTSTAITPDLLVLDEVLGVGDAYFAHKSYERIRDLCDREGSTLLLVTHDIYSALTICPRLIWIDRGRVLMDGDGAVVVKAYEDSIRQQEEERLRTRAQHNLGPARLAKPDVTSRVMIEVHAANNEPQACPVYFSDLELLMDGVPVAALPMDGSAGSGAYFQVEGSAWGELTEWQGRMARPLLNFGSPFHKVAAAFDREPDAAGRTWSVRLRYWSAVECQLNLHSFEGTREHALGELPPSRGDWQTFETTLGQGGEGAAAGVNISGSQGTGAIWISSVEAVGAEGTPSHYFEHASPLHLRIHYEIHAPHLREHAQVLVAFHRDGVQDVCRICTSDLEFDAARSASGVVHMRIPRVALGVGTYTVTVMITEQGYFDRRQTVFYSINPGVYCSLSRVFEIVIEGGGIVATGTGTVGEAEWSLAAGDQ